MQVSNKEKVKSKGEGKCRRSVIKGNKAYRVYREEQRRVRLDNSLTLS
jgi:hypothetical protein